MLKATTADSNRAYLRRVLLGAPPALIINRRGRDVPLPEEVLDLANIDASIEPAVRG